MTTKDKKILQQQAQHYVLCYNHQCSRHDHCLHYILGTMADPTIPTVNIVNPMREDITADRCTDYRSDEKQRMARGMTTFFDNIPEAKAKAIRHDIIDAVTRSRYFRWRSGTVPITPADQQQISDICRANGWNEPLVFDSYYEEYNF